MKIRPNVKKNHRAMRIKHKLTRPQQIKHMWPQIREKWGENM